MTYRLLLADDSVTIQRVIELTFADEDIDVVAVGDGHQAIDRIRAEAPDIVLADVDMPERDGFEVAEFVKRTPEYAHIPVVLLTGAFEPVDESRVAAIGCEGVLAKPFEPQLLIARVKQLLSASDRARADEQARLASAVERTPTTPPSAGTEAGTANDVVAGAQPGTTGLPATVSLDEYFERLDRAFSTLGTTPPASDVAGDAVAGWTVPAGEPWQPAGTSLEGDERKRAGDVTPTVETARLGEGPGTPSLASTFSALLAAEQGKPLPPGSIPVLPAAVLPLDTIVEEVSRRVVSTLASRAVREQVAALVADIAERLVREEIERLKASVP